MWGMTPEPEPKPITPSQLITRDRNPDHNPSFSLPITGVAGNRVIRIYTVKGLGVIVQEAFKHPSEDGRLIFTGMSIFTREEIGYSDVAAAYI